LRVHVASMLRTCCEYVVNAVTCNIQHHESFFPPPPCCDYIATMLRPVMRATSNIMSSTLDTNSNITCLQHQNSTSATLKFNVCNTQ
jgi:hypothetical protein